MQYRLVAIVPLVYSFLQTRVLGSLDQGDLDWADCTYWGPKMLAGKKQLKRN